MLTELNLEGNGIGEAGAVALAEAIKVRWTVYCAARAVVRPSIATATNVASTNFLATAVIDPPGAFTDTADRRAAERGLAPKGLWRGVFDRSAIFAQRTLNDSSAARTRLIAVERAESDRTSGEDVSRSGGDHTSDLG